MLRDKMDLRVRLMVLPFTEFNFYKKHKMSIGPEHLWMDPLEGYAKSGDPIGREHKEIEHKLYSTFYQSLNATNAIHNLDEIKLLVQKYFGFEKVKSLSKQGQQMSRFYLDHLKQLSKFFLTHRNGKISLKYWESEKENAFLGPYSGVNKVVMWNSMERLFTTDLLVLLYLIENKMEQDFYLRGYHGGVNLSDTQLDQILQRGVAENHMHLNAGGTFYLTWRKLMSNSGGSEPLHDQLIVKGYDSLLPYIQAMRVVRILLAKFLNGRPDDNQDKLFDYYAKHHKTIHQTSTIITEYLQQIVEGTQFPMEKSVELNNLFEQLKSQFSLSIRTAANSKAEGWRKQLAYSDIIHSLIPDAGEYNTVEVLLLFQCLKYMNSEQGTVDSFFCNVFWQYIRIKNETYQLYVQSNYVRGLENFMGYSRRKLSAGPQDWGLVLHQQFSNEHLKKLEIRIKPKDKDKNKSPLKVMAQDFKKILELYKELLSDYEGSAEQNLPELGIVIHFLKREDDIEKCWLGYRPDLKSRETGIYDSRMLQTAEPTSLYFEERQKEYKRQMDNLHLLREDIPGLADYIVGIDAAGPELETEPWVFSTVFKEARDSRTHKLLYEKQKSKSIRNLGFTYHVGEDFRHLLSGLRRVHEVVEHFQFHAGDRIGHGIALGVDPERWIQRNAVIIMPRIEYMENLLWIWGLHKNGIGASLSFDATYLEQQILKIAEQIYHHIDGITVYSLWKAYQSKFSKFEKVIDFTVTTTADEKRNKLFCPYVETNNTWNVDKLIYAQHCKCYLHYMLEPIQIAVKPEDAPFFTQVQMLVRSYISREGIIVETNPTSNTSIGEIDDLFQHYINTLNKRGFTESIEAESGLMVTINSDDPLIFNTNISNEYAYIFYSLLEKKYARNDILEWMERIREMGMQASFVPIKNMNVGERQKELEAIIAELNKVT
ncbi:hypothetical protein [Paenibacillus sp. MMS18-CY102]|uniref:hypothetical protein n=1 Tax=Paenibacillus sp. MMS18-CY102 TaxID=2682849 RepID=UPI001365D9B6|nr:hypothetical protein [Paenibacillus sp. MMS18-CY102]MWC29597.1 hypothetical protein [Paenibacillus sp. MMS18-CY102]